MRILALERGGFRVIIQIFVEAFCFYILNNLKLSMDKYKCNLLINEMYFQNLKLFILIRIFLKQFLICFSNQFCNYPNYLTIRLELILTNTSLSKNFPRIDSKSSTIKMGPKSIIKLSLEIISY